MFGLCLLLLLLSGVLCCAVRSDGVLVLVNMVWDLDGTLCHTVGPTEQSGWLQRDWAGIRLKPFIDYISSNFVGVYKNSLKAKKPNDLPTDVPDVT